ncbi:MAG: hypothetical protein M0Z66_05035 [Thermaerobacter sp.]|nr:hypothetical protein [Thermaerobacter sp.]
MKEALSRLSVGEDLSGTVLENYVQALEGDATDAASFLRDALLSADVGKPAGAGGEILRLSYVERIGGHEAIADRRDLP